MSINKKEIWRTIKFTLVAASAGLIEFGSSTLLDRVVGLKYEISYFIGLVLSVLWNFTINRRYTFHSASNIPKAMFLVFLYYLAFTPLSTVFGGFLKGKGWNHEIVTIINMLLNFVTEYLYQRFVVFRKTIDTNNLANK